MDQNSELFLFGNLKGTAYDGLGRTVSQQKSDGASTTYYNYAGNQTTVTDPAGNWKTTTKDVEGNLITVLEPDPANQPASDVHLGGG